MKHFAVKAKLLEPAAVNGASLGEPAPFCRLLSVPDVVGRNDGVDGARCCCGQVGKGKKRREKTYRWILILLMAETAAGVCWLTRVSPGREVCRRGGESRGHIGEANKLDVGRRCVCVMIMADSYRQEDISSADAWQIQSAEIGCHGVLLPPSKES